MFLYVEVWMNACVYSCDDASLLVHSFVSLSDEFRFQEAVWSCQHSLHACFASWRQRAQIRKRHARTLRAAANARRQVPWTCRLFPKHPIIIQQDISLCAHVHLSSLDHLRGWVVSHKYFA